MKRWYIVFLILIITALLAACSGSPATDGEPSMSEEDPNDPANVVTIDIVIEALQNPDDWVVIDVRTPEEYNGESRLPNAFGSGRIKGAVNVNRELIFDSDGELLPRDEIAELYEFIDGRKAIVYCHGGTRSAFIWSILTDLGFDVLNYSGSWVDWSRAASIADGNPNEAALGLTEAWFDNEEEI